MTFRGRRGEQKEIAVSVRAQANTGDGVRALVLADVGFGALREPLIADDLRRGALVQVAWSESGSRTRSTPRCPRRSGDQSA